MECCKHVLKEIDLQNCSSHYDCNPKPVKPHKPWGPTQFIVRQMDTLKCAQLHYNNKEMVCVLNMANEQWMGDRLIKRGFWTQEEHLLLRTCLSRMMRKKCYPLPLLGGSVHSNIIVFADEQFRVLPEKEWFTVDIVTMAAERQPKLLNSVQLCITSENLMYHKIIAMLRMVARRSLCSTLILGAWGCGAFGHPAKHVARLFKRVLNMPEFKNRWLVVVFAIKDAPGQHTDSYLMFHDEFVNKK